MLTYISFLYCAEYVYAEEHHHIRNSTAGESESTTQLVTEGSKEHSKVASHW